MSWTPQQLDELDRLWATGLPTAAIGERMGMTKNAIVGMAHRRKLKARPSLIRPRDPDRPAKPRVPRERVMTLPSAPGLPALAVAPAGLPLPAAVVTPPARAVFKPIPAGACQYPLWPNGPVPRPARFCGKPTEAGGSWCPACRGVVFTQVQLTPAAQARLARLG